MKGGGACDGLTDDGWLETHALELAAWHVPAGCPALVHRFLPVEFTPSTGGVFAACREDAANTLFADA